MKKKRGAGRGRKRSEKVGGTVCPDLRWQVVGFRRRRCRWSWEGEVIEEGGECVATVVVVLVF
jgi:hypothetical protein